MIHDPYWTADEEIGREELDGEPYGVRRIVTRSWEPVNEQPAWRQFLRSLGYEPVAECAFDRVVDTM
jgi:hypothetical protein